MSPNPYTNNKAKTDKDTIKILVYDFGMFTRVLAISDIISAFEEFRIALGQASPL
jgi:hypothetical protein